jgi:predicted transglutaminase-like cysteine proteinase
MRLFGWGHAWRAAILACGLFWLVPAVKATENVGGAPDFGSASDEPFGLAASTVSAGGAWVKWTSLARKLDDERVQLALCDGDRDDCASTAALQLLAIVDGGRAREGRARLGEINRAINLSIRPMSDLAQYGQIDVWNSPLQTFYRGAGDCEDYAIAKFMALSLAGLAAEDLRIVILRDTIRGEDHAIAAARLDGRWLMLDNRRMAMVEDQNIRNYRPLFVIDQSGIMKYADAPLFAAASSRDVAPSTLSPE